LQRLSFLAGPPASVRTLTLLAIRDPFRRAADGCTPRISRRALDEPPTRIRSGADRPDGDRLLNGSRWFDRNRFSIR
jgi:hypothetical protein